MVVPDSPRRERTLFLGDVVGVEAWIAGKGAEVQLF
jgi:hypothetical protein